MILIDANLLVYALVGGVPNHARARDWLDAQPRGISRVAWPWPSPLAFLRVVTNPGVFERPEPTISAWRQFCAWLESEVVWIPHPGERHRENLATMVALPSAKANLVPDAHLAALAIEHGLLLCSADGDFARFPGLRGQDPLRT